MPFPFLAAAGLAVDAFSALSSHNGAAAANKANVKLAKENRDWETEMANTAYQRKRKDLEAAGYNPMFGVEGAGAAVPVLAPARVENESAQSSAIAASSMDKLQSKLAMQAQIQNVQANTAKAAAEARKAQVEANNAEKFGPQNAFYDSAERKANAWAATVAADIAKDTQADQVAMTKAEREIMERTLPAVIELAQNQAETGKLNLSALRAESEMSETTFGKILPYIRAVLGIGTQGAGIYRSLPGRAVDETVTNSTRAGGRQHTETTRIRRR